MLSREYPNLYIDGRWQEPHSARRLDVISPRTGRKIGYVPHASNADVDRAVEAARRAFYETDWKDRPVEERAEMCERLATLIAERQPEFRDLIVDELGITRFLADLRVSGWLLPSTRRRRRSVSSSSFRAWSCSPRLDRLAAALLAEMNVSG